MNAPGVGEPFSPLVLEAGRVLASLWPVQDRATAVLMEQFYKRYAVGADPGVALAAAPM
ncbi:MAG: CHAT domain-containing protein [Gemmatimonadaceae bacterium]|nr:CHAT domain-containing protein [Gemmatimonadaceae bacterium]